MALDHVYKLKQVKQKLFPRMMTSIFMLFFSQLSLPRFLRKITVRGTVTSCFFTTGDIVLFAREWPLLLQVAVVVVTSAQLSLRRKFKPVNAS